LRTQTENGSEVIDLRRSQTSHDRFYESLEGNPK